MSAHCRTSAFVVLAVCAVLVAAPAAGAQDKAAAPPDRAGLADTTFAAATVKPAVPVRAFPFDLKKVRLLDGPFKTAMDRDLAYMIEPRRRPAPPHVPGHGRPALGQRRPTAAGRSPMSSCAATPPAISFRRRP